MSASDSSGSDADRPRETAALPPSSPAVLASSPAVPAAPVDPGSSWAVPAAPLDPVVEPAGPPATAAATESTPAAAAAVGAIGRMTSASVKAQRKTCILKLDGCHYTIGT